MITDDADVQHKFGLLPAWWQGRGRTIAEETPALNRKNKYSNEIKLVIAAMDHYRRALQRYVHDGQLTRTRSPASSMTRTFA